MISVILDKITPMNLETQIDYFKAAFETDFDKHLPTPREVKDKTYNRYTLKTKQIIHNLLILFSKLSRKPLILNDVEGAYEVLIYLKKLLDQKNHWSKYKELKPLLIKIIEVLNIRIPYKNGRSIGSTNDNFEDATNKLTSKELYKIIIEKLEAITKRTYKENKEVLTLYRMYYKLLEDDMNGKEYDKITKKINKKVPNKFDIYTDGRKDYMRTLMNYLNRVEEVREHIKKDKEQHEERTITEEQQEKAKQRKEEKAEQRKEETKDEDDVNAILNNEGLLNKEYGYQITITRAELSNTDLSKVNDFIAIENTIYYTPFTDEAEIEADLEQQIKNYSDFATQVVDAGGFSFEYKLVKEEYHANIEGDCLKVALKCYNIDFDGRFEDMITNKEILNKVGFYNEYGNLEFGNIKTNDKILLYRNHAIAINTNFKRIHTKDSATTLIIPYYEFNHKLNLCESNNIPYRCFKNDVNKGSVEIFESDSDFNDYDKPITGLWIKYKYAIDKYEDIKINRDQNNKQKAYYAVDSDDEHYKEEYVEDLTDINTYIKEMDSETKNNTDDNTEITINDNYYEQINEYSNDEQLIILQSMDYDYIDMMEDARKEFIELSKWFDNKIIEQCKNVMKAFKVECTDKYINKHKFDIITPVFPYSYRERCSYTKYLIGENGYKYPYDVIDMEKAYWTAYKEMKEIFCISNIPMKEMMKGTTINDYIIYVKSNIIYNGFYRGVLINIIKKIDNKATFEYYRIYQRFNINTEEMPINNYKIAFGMLITGSTKYKFKNQTHNTYIKEIHADYDYNALLHLNIMISRNTNMLREINLQYKKKKVLPKGYVVDSILYNLDDNIKKAQTKYFKDTELEPKNKYSNVDPQYEQKYDYYFGVAGSGKSTELTKLYRGGHVVIVNNYNLYKMYQDKNINVVLWQRVLNEHQPIYTTKIYIDEIFTFSNTDIEKIYYMCNYTGVRAALFGDYNQLNPISNHFYVNSFKNCLRYVEHDYIYTNYRNTLEYNGKDAWIMDIENKTESIINKRKKYIKRLIKAGFVKISNKGKTIRYCRKDAEENEKVYNGKYYMIKNYSNLSVPSRLKLICQTDVLYTNEELKNMLGDEYNKYKRYIVNNNCVSFYNTQGQTLKKMHIINEDTIDAIAKDGRMFYVFVSRLSGDISV